MNTQQTQEVDITVDGGYSPNVVRVAKGKPVRFAFDRREKSPCSSELVIAAFGIRQTLAPFARTVVEFTPDHIGTFPFSCGMNMLRGQIQVEG
jgi:Cu+-exporting ATPase